MSAPEKKSTIRPPITWFGSKARLANKIIALFPNHHTYVDLFGGSGAVLLAKQRSAVEVYNDIDQGLFNLFRVLRDPDMSSKLLDACLMTLYAKSEFEFAAEPSEDPVESARRFIVRSRMSRAGLGAQWSFCVNDSVSGMSSAVRRWTAGIERLPAIRDRLCGVQIDASSWEAAIARYDNPNTLFYMDPPYSPDTRINGKYRHDFTQKDHKDFIESITALSGMAILSGYRNDLYDSLGWDRIDFSVPAWSSDKRSRRIESVWLSPRASMIRESACAI